MTDPTQLIKKILLAFEQSRTTIKYNSVYLWDDGPKNIKQVTLSFGITEYGNLKKFLKQYCQSGKYAQQFQQYIPLIGKTSLANNADFIALLKEAAQDPLMQQCQEKAFDSMYITPALNWCSTNKLELPLSKAIISDSYLHSGSILKIIRNMFPAVLPTAGGDEKDWVSSYCSSRRKWLANHSRKDLNKTTYRMDFFISLIKNSDWNLSAEKYTANGVKIVAN
jgi:chitosanase